jgi:hypothetical protein
LRNLVADDAGTADNARGFTDRKKVGLSAVLGNSGRGIATPKIMTIVMAVNRNWIIYPRERVSFHSEAAAVKQRTHPVLWSTNWCNKFCPIVIWAGFSGNLVFLNFDVAILCNRAQHLLALACKVEQGGLNG